MKKIFKIDCGLYPLGLFTILSGIGVHTAGHGDNHQIWEIWAVVHSIIAVSFSVLIAYHVHTHRTWFKALRRNTIFKKQPMTTMLSVACLVTMLSGITLIGIWGYKHTYRTITLYNWHRFYSSHAGSWGKKNTCHKKSSIPKSSEVA